LGTTPTGAKIASPSPSRDCSDQRSVAARAQAAAAAGLSGSKSTQRVSQVSRRSATPVGAPSRPNQGSLASPRKTSATSMAIRAVSYGASLSVPSSASLPGAAISILVA
jgi:hypothetical protein